MVAIQIIVSCIAVLCFYDVLRNVLSSHRIAFAIIFLFGISPSIMGWDKIILTESLSLSGSVFFIWLLVRYLKKPSFTYGILINILITILIFLRPTFLVNYCILIAFWLARFFMYLNERKILRKNLIVSGIIGMMVVGYCAKFNEQYGVFTLSGTKTQQDCITVVQHSLWYDVQYVDAIDKEIVSIIQENNLPEDERGCITAAGAVLGKYDLSDIAQFCKRATKTKAFLKHKFYTLFLLSDIDLSNNVWYGTNVYNAHVIYNEDDIPLYSVCNSMTIRKIVNIWRRLTPTIRFIHVYIISILEFVIVIFGLIKRKDVWIHLGIGSFLMSICITSIWGTCGEFGRTAICVLPYVYFAVAIYVEFLYGKIVNNTQK